MRATFHLASWIGGVTMSSWSPFGLASDKLNLRKGKHEGGAQFGGLGKHVCGFSGNKFGAACLRFCCLTWVPSKMSAEVVLFGWLGCSNALPVLVDSVAYQPQFL